MFETAVCHVVFAPPDSGSRKMDINFYQLVYVFSIA